MVDCAGCDYDTCRREDTMSAETSSIEEQAPELVISESINNTGFTLTDIRSKKVVRRYYKGEKCMEVKDGKTFGYRERTSPEA